MQPCCAQAVSATRLRLLQQQQHFCTLRDARPYSSGAPGITGISAVVRCWPRGSLPSSIWIETDAVGCCQCIPGDSGTLVFLRHRWCLCWRKQLKRADAAAFGWRLMLLLLCCHAGPSPVLPPAEVIVAQGGILAQCPVSPWLQLGSWEIVLYSGMSLFALDRGKCCCTLLCLRTTAEVTVDQRGILLQCLRSRRRHIWQQMPYANAATPCWSFQQGPRQCAHTWMLLYTLSVPLVHLRMSDCCQLWLPGQAKPQRTERTSGRRSNKYHT